MMESTTFTQGGGKMKFPFEGLHSQKYYVEGDPLFDAKVEEISEACRAQAPEGTREAVIKLLREGGASFLRVPWIAAEIDRWKQGKSDGDRLYFGQLQSLLSGSREQRGGEKPITEKTLMLKDYDTYLERYTILHEKRSKICGDCGRYRQDAYVVSCFNGCDYPDRFEKLQELADDVRRLSVLFRYPPVMMALRLAVVDGEIFKRRRKG